MGNPLVTIIIPTFNDAKKIGLTLESLVHQSDLDYEILVIDAASKDRTIEIVKSFRDEKIRLHSVSEFNRYEMMNKGIFLARGKYLNFLFSGDYYLLADTLKIITQLASENKEPSLVYSGCLIRELDKDARVLFQEFSLRLLKSGRQPTSLQACWFHKKTFHSVGKFNAYYELRGDFDFLCRLRLDKETSSLGVNRVLTDYDPSDFSKAMLIRHFSETAQIIFKNFGFRSASKWLFQQKDISRYCHCWVRSFKKALIGKA